MCERKSQRNCAANSVAHQNGVFGDLKLVEAVLDDCEIGVHERQHRRLRAMKSGQIDQGHAMFGGERLQDRIERVPIGKKRMEDDKVTAGARSHGGQGTAPGTQWLHWHGNPPGAAPIPDRREFYSLGTVPQTAKTITRNLALLSILCKIAGRARRSRASQLPL